MLNQKLDGVRKKMVTARRLGVKRFFVTPWALTNSVTTAFHCSEELDATVCFLLRRFLLYLHVTLHLEAKQLPAFYYHHHIYIYI